MAGFLTALNGHVYEGEYKAGEALNNGMFAYINGGKVYKLAATKDTFIKITGKLRQWGLYWLEGVVIDAQDDEIYFIENEWDYLDTAPFNEATFACKEGDYVRMRRLAVGDRVCFTVSPEQYVSQKIGNTTQPGSGGYLLAAPEVPVLTTDLEETDEPTIGDAYSLAVVAEAVTDGGTLTYAWYKNGVAISGATSATLAVAAATYATATNDGAYKCVVTNTLNSMTNSTESTTIVLTGKA